MQQIEAQKLENTKQLQQKISKILQKAAIIPQQDANLSVIEPSVETIELLRFAFSLECREKTLKEAQVDLDKYPLGLLSQERIKKSF